MMENVEMKVFWNNSFAGHYPVGTSGIVVAESQHLAKEMLEVALGEIGLKQEVLLEEVVELSLLEPITLILQDGNH